MPDTGAVSLQIQKFYLFLRITDDFDTSLTLQYEHNRQKIMINYLDWAITVITKTFFVFFERVM